METLLHVGSDPSRAIVLPHHGGCNRQALKERQICSQEGSPGVEASAHQCLLQAGRNSPEHMPYYTPKCIPKDIPRQHRYVRVFTALGSSSCEVFTVLD